jgi:hypothetical protein
MIAPLNPDYPAAVPGGLADEIGFVLELIMEEAISL